VSRTPPLLALVALSGCAASLGSVGLLRRDADEVGLKLLQPAVSGRSCRDSVVGVPLQRGEPDVREALSRILALDAEGNVVANAEIRWVRVVTGIYNRRCVEVRGDLARAVSVIRLPAPPGHEGHGRH
jgi:hypothetical protein